MYDLHSLHGQFSVSHFLISFLKACNDVCCSNSSGTIFQIFGPRNKIFSVPQKHFLRLVIQIVKTVVNCDHYSLIEKIVSQ